VLEFWSPGAYAVDVSPRALVSILAAAEGSLGVETGGILLGRYTIHGEAAVVEEASGPPKDSRRGPRTFWRGVAGVRERLENLWEDRGGYYLGEWHYHPSSPAVPSGCDLNEMAKVAGSPGYSCPEPLLLIVGGDKGLGWEFSMRVFEDSDGEVVLARRYSRASLQDRLQARPCWLSSRTVADTVGVTTKTVRRWRRGINSPTPCNRQWIEFLLDAVDALETSLYWSSAPARAPQVRAQLLRLIRDKEPQDALRLLEDRLM